MHKARVLGYHLPAPPWLPRARLALEVLALSILFRLKYRRYNAFPLHCCSRWLGASRPFSRSLQAYSSRSPSDRPKPISERMAWRCKRKPVEQVAHVLDGRRGMCRSLMELACFQTGPFQFPRADTPGCIDRFWGASFYP